MSTVLSVLCSAPVGLSLASTMRRTGSISAGTEGREAPGLTRTDPVSGSTEKRRASPSDGAIW